MHITATIVAVGTPGGLGVACTPAGCFQVAAVVRTSLLALSGLVGLLATLSYLSDAHSACREERRRVRAEADALETFADRVRALAPATPTATGPTSQPRLVAETGTDTDTDTGSVRDAYRETMLELDHYEDDYGEPLAVNLRAELGPDLATAVESERPLTPDLQQAIVANAESACAERVAFLSELSAEADDLAASTERLERVSAALEEAREAARVAGFETLADRWRQLDRMEDACTEVVEDRRASLADRDAFDLAQYLYDGLDARFPVLAAAASLAGEVRAERQRTTDMLTRVV